MRETNTYLKGEVEIHVVGCSEEELPKLLRELAAEIEAGVYVILEEREIE